MNKLTLTAALAALTLGGIVSTHANAEARNRGANLAKIGHYHRTAVATSYALTGEVVAPRAQYRQAARRAFFHHRIGGRNAR